MEFKFDDDKLTITADDGEQAELAEMRLNAGGASYFPTAVLHDWFEDLLGNSELEWINPDDTGDLTDAPMLGILGEEGMRDITVFATNYGLVETGHEGHWTLCKPIIQRWAYMNYQVKSPLVDLADHGKVVFVAKMPVWQRML